MLVFKPKTSLQKRLFFWFVGLSVLPMLLLVAINQPQIKNTLKKNAATLLAQTAEAKASFVINWFDFRFKDLDYQAQDPRNTAFLQSLSSGLSDSRSSPKSYIQSFDWTYRKSFHESNLLNLTRKYTYIYDVFLIDLHGNILFTVVQEEDLGSNLLIGDNSNTLFSHSVRETLNTGRSLFSGIERYAPSKNMLTGFLTAPLLDEFGEKIGVLAIQIKLDKLYQQITTSQTSQTSQKHYIIDTTGLLLSPIHNRKQILVKKLPPPTAIAKTSGGYSLEPYTGPEGSPVYGYQTTIKIANINWLLMSEITQKEALAASNKIQNMTFFFGALLTVFAGIAGLIQSKRIVKPIIKLSQVTHAVTQGKSRQQVDIENNDEIGELTETFNHMIKVREEYITTIHDNNKQIQKTLNELSEQKFAFDQHAIVAITDLAGTITYVNKRFCDISGFTQSELIGSNHRILNSAYHPAAFFTQMFVTISAGHVWHDEICNQNKEGTLYWVDTTVVPIKNANGELTSYIAIRTDISHIKQVETELIQAANEAETANIAKSEFLANMSHEIRTPLNGVIGMNNLLLNSGLNQEQYQRCKIVNSSANGLLTIINDILDFSKIEAGKLELELIDFNLATLISDIGSSMAFRAEEKGIELICPANPIDSYWYKGDPGRIRQILVNLIGNAIKFTPDGEVSVNVNVIDNKNGQYHLLVEVIDTGIGLTSDQQQGLFERFTQADGSTTRKYGGTGLGLTISKQLVELMGGEIHVESSINEGSAFSFALTIEQSKQVAPLAPAINLNEQSILVVDDNYTNRKLLSELFNYWGLSYEQTENGEDALQKLIDAAAQEQPFSIAIIDMQMPSMDGAKLAQLIRQHESIAKTRIILLTSQALRGDAKKMQQIGVNGFLTKPVNQSDLYHALLQITGQGEDTRLITCHTARELSLFDAHVLVVEDNLTNQLVAKGMLEEFGITVSIAANGEEAIASLTKQHYDLVFMDCQMPIMDGFQATRLIRDINSNVQQHDIPVIAMTANVMADDKARCQSAGMNDFIAKPVNPTILHEMLNTWLTQQSSNKQDSSDYIDEDQQALEASKKMQLAKPEEQIFDPSVLQQLLSNEAQIQSIIDAFISEVPSHLEQLTSALEQSDANNVAALAHKIKGSASSIGANVLAQIAKHIEIASREGKLETLAQDLSELTAAFKQLQATLLE